MIAALRQNRRYNITFSVMSILMLLVSMFIAPIFAHAEEGDPNVVQRASGNWTQMWHEKYANKGWVKDKATGYSIETDVIKFGDGSIAYCLEMMLTSPNGHSLEEKARLSDEYYRIMNSGYPVKSPADLGANSWQVAHYATQIAVWVINKDVSYSNLQFNNANVKQVVDKILADAGNSNQTQDLSFSLSPNHIKAENVPWSKDYKQAGAFEVVTNGHGTFEVEAINAPGPVTFVNSNGEKKNTFNSYEKFFAQVSTDLPTGSFQIRAKGTVSKTETVWYKSHNAGIQHTTALVTLQHKPVAENASVSWDSNGEFKIKKVDEKGNPLSGAKFEVINWNNQVVKNLTTDSNGMATADGLWFEDYTVKETQAPDGYEMDATPQKVKVDSKDKTLTFVNKKSKGGIKIHKVDDQDRPLEGVEFTIYGNDGLEMYKKLTDANGEINLSDLPYGQYHFKESKGLEGYEYDGDVKHVTINADNQNQTIKVVNKEIKGSVKVHKVDDANKPLKGVEFTVFKKNGASMGTVITDENGYAVMEHLPYGEYTLVESKGLDGYEVDKKETTFTIGKDGLNPEIKVVNKKMKGGLHITKTDDASKPLKGVEFTLYKDGKEVKKATTDANGKVSFPDLELGKYTYKETKGIEGYVPDTEEKAFELNPSKRSHEATVINKKIVGSVEITKTDDAKKPLQGVEFTVYKDGKEYKKAVTDANGKITLTGLPMGKYTFKETKGLVGHVANTEEKAFEIKNLGDSHKFTVVNKVIKGSIEITKTDDSKKPLAGVEFTVFKDGKEYTKVTTNDKGIAEIKNLPYGEYTFKETKGIEGYIPDSATKLVDIKEDGKTHKFTVINKKIKGNLEIVKTDDAKKPLKGVEFTVYDAKDKEVTKVVTDEKGKASVKDLPYGKYYFKETKGLEGYLFDKAKTEFEIKNLNDTKQFTVTNKLIRSNIQITKVDDETKPLKGVEFTIYDSKDKEIAKVVTDEKGFAEYKNLPYGSYYFKETKNLEGYVKNAKKYDFEVKQDMQTLKFDVINKKIRGSVEVLKVAADKKEQPLAGVEFTLFDQNNKVIGKPALTDKNGKVSFDRLPYGKYYIKETKTIKGYNINEEKFPVDIKEDGQVVKHTVTNKVIRGNVELLKIDTENKDAKLQNAEFELRGSNDEILGKYKTDKDGKLVIKNLVFGDYKLIETKAPTGFVLDQTPIEFSITEEGKTIALTKENTKIYGDLEITKVDTADAKKKLANAKFEIYNEKGDKVVEGVTDENGVATFKHLVFGKYTFKEVVAPEGYFLNETIFDFEILENGKIVQKKVEDEKVPAIKTTATDKHDGTKEMHTSKKVTIQDKVEYKDLLVGKEYLVKGKLMDKETGKPLVVDGKEVKAEATFKPKEANGSITLDFTFDATGLEEKEVVVFEDLIKEGKTVATHSDLEDKDQTVKFVKPSVKTTATNKEDGGKEIHAKESITIQDVVEYQNLVVGKEYTVKGKLMNKVTNKPLLIDGKEVTSETKFTATEKNGSVTLDFTFVGAELQGREIVVFEDLLHEGDVIATHSDINDEGQTVKFVEPSIKTTATNKEDGSKELDANESVTIQDKVEYKDLIIGKEYVVKGKLMDKETNKPLVVDGKEVTAEHKFTAENKDGFITLDFTLNATALQGKEVVVFEEMYQDSVLVAIHSDIEDKDQTVKFKVKPEQPKPEQPKPEQPKPEQPKPEQPKVEQPKPDQPKAKHEMAKTGGKESYIPYLGFAFIVLAGGFMVLALVRKNKQQN